MFRWSMPDIAPMWTIDLPTCADHGTAFADGEETEIAVLRMR
jgi:hypothetical protein